MAYKSFCQIGATVQLFGNFQNLKSEIKNNFRWKSVNISIYFGTRFIISIIRSALPISSNKTNTVFQFLKYLRYKMPWLVEFGFVWYSLKLEITVIVLSNNGLSLGTLLATAIIVKFELCRGPCSKKTISEKNYDELILSTLTGSSKSEYLKLVKQSF